MYGRPLLIKNPTPQRHPQRVTGIDVGQGNAVTLQKSELVASFVNRSNLLQEWKKTGTCEVKASGVHGPKNAAIMRSRVLALCYRVHVFF